MHHENEIILVMQDNLKFYNYVMPIAFSIVLSLGIFIVLGMWLDKKIYGNPSLFTVIGVFLGLISGAYNSWRFVRKLLHAIDQADQERKNNP